jgi:hypothetical protein
MQRVAKELHFELVEYNVGSQEDLSKEQLSKLTSYPDTLSVEDFMQLIEDILITRGLALITSSSIHSRIVPKFESTN